MTKRYRGEAAASFFIVGLGQLLKGEEKRGLILILFFYFVLPAAIYLSLLISAWLFLLVLGAAVIFGIALWAYNVWDALKHEKIV